MGKSLNIGRTTDTFIDSIQWSENRAVLVHRREHGGRTYVRFRTWNRHKTLNVWYPSKRSFVIPVGNAEPLADALRAGAESVESPKPDWFVAWEQEHAEKVAAEKESKRALAKKTRPAYQRSVC